MRRKVRRCGAANKAGKVRSVECSKCKEVGKGVEVGEEEDVVRSERKMLMRYYRIGGARRGGERCRWRER